MTLVTLEPVNPDEEITADSANRQPAALAAALNGNIDDTNISSVSGAKIANNTITYAKLDFPLSLGYAQITSNVTSTTTVTQIPGLTATVTIPAGSRRIKITAFARDIFHGTAGAYNYLSIWDGTVGSGTQLGLGQTYSNGGAPLGFVMAVVTPSAGTKTYNIGLQCTTATGLLEASATNPAFILVEAI